VKKLLVLALLASTSAAYAQDPPDEKARLVKEAAESDPTPEDPTAHFNFTNFDWRGKDEFGGAFGDGQQTDEHGVTHHEEEPMSPPFLYALLNFGLLLLLLAKYGRPAARKVAEDRHDQIKSALDEAAKLRDEAAKKLKDYETRIKDVDDEIKKLVDGIRSDAEADKKRILEQAERQAEQMKRDAELRIAAEIELARASLAKEVTTAASKATEKILRDKTTPDDQNRLVSTFISGMGGN
jgi:F-type H+-transporting ATPase subunit b